MSSRIGSPSGNCACWAPVIGTMLILIGLFDLGFGLSLAGISIELGHVSGELHANSGLISFGEHLSSLTGGFLNLGSDVAQGVIAKSVLEQLPPIWFSLLMAVGRVVLSILAIFLGTLLARRMRRAIRPLRHWSIIALIWGLVAIVGGWGLYRFLEANSGFVATAVVLLIDVGLHVIWPLVVLRRLAAQKGHP